MLLKLQCTYTQKPTKMKTSLYFFVSFCIILLYLTDLIPWVNGIKGYNFILGLQHHDVIPGYVIDYMHGTLLGVTKTMMMMMMCFSQETKTARGKDFFIGEDVP